MFSDWVGESSAGEENETDPYWFHIVDRSLHGIVTALILPVAGYTLRLLSTNEYVSSMSLATGRYGGEWRRKCRVVWVTAFFAVHPIHVEAVANSTGRAEVLCALFYLLGFWVYAKLAVGASLGSKSLLVNHQSALVSVVGVLVMMVCTLASMLCKEHGVTLPIICVVWDSYIGTATSIPELIKLEWSSTIHTKRNKDSSISLQTTNNNERQTKSGVRQNQCKVFVLRAIIIILLTLLLAYWRLSKNGTSAANLVCEQNPAACEPNTLIRFVHLAYLWCLNFWLMLCPTWLSPDWSGISVPLISHPATDIRVPVVFMGLGLLGLMLYHAFVAAVTPLPFSHNSVSTGLSPASKKLSNSKAGETVDDPFEVETKIVSSNLWRRTIVTCFFWMIIPFITSSNLLVYVGFVIADRTLYLPSFGFCLLLVEGLVSLPSFLYHSSERATISNEGRTKSEGLPKEVSPSSSTTKKSNASTLPWVCASIILVLYTAKQQAQTKRWGNKVLIWEEAYRINPFSCMNGNMYGLEMVVEGRNKDAAKVLMLAHKREMSEKLYMKDIKDAGSSSSGENSIAGSLYDSMITLFKLSLALVNSGNCDKARPLIEDGLTMIDDTVRDTDMQLQKLGYNLGDNVPKSDTAAFSILRDNDNMMFAKAYLLVSKSRCAFDVSNMGQFAYDAVMAKPDHDYALTHAKDVDGIITQIREKGLDPKDVKVIWETSADGQTAEFNVGVIES